MAFSTRLILTFALVGIATLLLETAAECKLPSTDNIYMKMGIECQKEVGNEMMCIADCLAKRTGVVDQEGNVHGDAMDEAIEKLEEGDLKDAIVFTKEKCFKEGLKIKMGVPKCGGYLQVAKCIRKHMKAKCPQLAAMYGI